jgi:uncharacterized protein (UPF0147 family)
MVSLYDLSLFMERKKECPAALASGGRGGTKWVWPDPDPCVIVTLKFQPGGDHGRHRPERTLPLRFGEEIQTLLPGQGAACGPRPSWMSSGREKKMDLKTLQETPAWDWPEDAGKTILGILRNGQADESGRLIAAELAGDLTVMNDELAEVLLSIARSDTAPEKLRGQAVISLGPVLEYVDTDGFEIAEGLEHTDDVQISAETFQKIQKTLRKLYMDAAAPKDVRRRAIEVSVRSPQDWHRDIIRAAYCSGDEFWRLTAVFCMRYVRGFNDQILEALESHNGDIHYEAVCAAGNWEVDAAWSHIARLVAAKKTDKVLRLAAIDALAGIRPKEAAAILIKLTNSDDEDIVEAAYEAMSVVDELPGDEDHF